MSTLLEEARDVSYWEIRRVMMRASDTGSKVVA